MFAPLLALAATAALTWSEPVQVPHTVPTTWEFRESEGVSLASFKSPDNILVAVRCSGRRLDVILSGLAPPDDSNVRWVLVSRNSGAPKREFWTADETRPIIYSGRPGYSARAFRSGGVFDLRALTREAPDGGAERRLEAPQDTENLDRVLAACGTPLQSPRDDLEVVELPLTRDLVMENAWDRLPAGAWPESASTQGITAGAAIVSCLVEPDGGVTDCEVEVETPENAGFGQSTLRGLRRARLHLSEAVQPGRLIVTQVRYRRVNAERGPRERP